MSDNMQKYYDSKYTGEQIEQIIDIFNKITPLTPNQKSFARSNIGITQEVLDVSNLNQKGYLTLQGAILDVPQQYRIGGLLIKYSSPNGYQLYLLTQPIWSNNPDDWESLKADTSDVEDLINNLVDSESSRASEAEDNLQYQIDVINGDATQNGSIKKAIADLIDGAPATYDTLKEISDYIKQDKDDGIALFNNISNHKSNINNPHHVTKEQLGYKSSNLKISCENTNGSDEVLKYTIKFTNAFGENTSSDFLIPTCTSEFAGLISPEDKKKLEAINNVSLATSTSDGLLSSTDFKKLQKLKFDTEDKIPSSVLNIPNASEQSSGLMSANDKKILNTLSAGSNADILDVGNSTDNTDNSINGLINQYLNQ